jgi:DNA polymerase
MTILHLDFETYSGVDIKKCGAQFYARHPSTEALMLAWAVDDGPVSVWDITAREMPPELETHLRVSCVRPTRPGYGTEIHAFNAGFERLILEHCLGIIIPPERFRCTQVRAFGMAFTGGLDAIAAQFNLGVAKDPRGSALINRFSKPQPAKQKVRRWTRENDPEGWAEFMRYCAQDVEVERKLEKKLAPYHFPEIEWKRYALDQKINDRGVPVDRNLVDTAIEIAEIEKARLMGELRRLTGVANPNSGPQLLAWLQGRGVELPDMTKETVATALEGPLFSDVREVLELKQHLAKTSVTKWNAFKRVLGPDDRARGMFQFGGASRTLRAAGRIVQLQNLARGGNTTKDPETAAEVMLAGGHLAARLLYGNAMGLLSDTTRAAIRAPEGRLLNVSDLSSIETRTAGWLMDCKAINQTFADGRCCYRELATRVFQVPYDQVTGKMRTYCKPPVLGGIYMLGGEGMQGYAAGMGIAMTKEESQNIVDILRDQWPELPEFWQWCKDAVFYTTRTGQPYEGPHGLRTFAHGEFLLIRLPSGRNLAYYQPKIEMRKAPWGQWVEAFTYMGINRYNLKWERVSAHPGGITENINQATARDVLYEWIDRADAAGFDIVLHVHDEIGAVEDRDRLEELNELIRKPISWAPGLNLDAAGYVAKRYKKD